MSSREPPEEQTARMPNPAPQSGSSADPTRAMPSSAPPNQEATRLDMDAQPTQIVPDEATRLQGSATQPPSPDPTTVLPYARTNPGLPPPSLAPPNPSTRTGTYQWARWAHVITALVAWFALGLQLYVVVTEAPRGEAIFTALLQYFSSFAVLATIVAALVASGLAANPIRNSSAFPTFRLDSLFMITLSGLIALVVVNPLWEPKPGQAAADYVLNYVVPVLVLAVYAAFGPRPRLEFRNIGPAFVIPVLWIVYTLAHGAISQWYPYAFINVETYGYGRVAANLAIMLLIGLLIAAVFVLIDKKLPWAPRR